MSSAVVAAACSTLSELVLAAQACKACADLASTRNRVVVGHHPQRASLLVVGEAPGALEDETGEPFVGKSGQLRFGPNGMPLAAMREDFALVASLLKGTR